MFFLSPDETLAALTAAFLGGALFGRIVWRRQAYDERLRTEADLLLRRAERKFRLVHDASPDCFALLNLVVDSQGNVQSFEATFEQHCEQPTAPALRGYVRFGSAGSSQQAQLQSRSPGHAA